MSPESEQFAQEAQRQEQRSKLNERLEELMKSGIKTEEIADILDADEFLYTQEVRSKKGGEVTGFDAKRFIDTQIAKELKLRLPQRVIKTNKTILPPGEGEIISGSGEGMKEKEYIPRTRYFMELMEEMDLEYTMIEGENTDEMMRQREYIPFAIPEKQRLVFICNEEGNATYIVASEDPEGEWEQYSEMTKDELREMREEVGGVGFVIWKGKEDKWKGKVKRLIEIKRIRKHAEINEEEKEKIEFAPEDWMTLPEVENYIGEQRHNINKITAKYKGDPNMMDKLRKTRGASIPALHYSPELIAIIQHEIKSWNLEERPEGWLTAMQLWKSLKVKVGKKKIKNKIEAFRESHPEWFKICKDKTGVPRDHVSPELVQIIKDEIESVEIASEGWITNKELRKVLGVGQYALGTILDKYRSKYSHWIKKLKPRGAGIGKGINAEHYSPELVQLLKSGAEDKSEFSKDRGEVPEGWMTLRAFADSKDDISRYKVKKIMKNQREINPSWFKKYRSLQGIINEYLSPEFLRYAEEELSKNEVAPEGWLTKNSAKVKLNISHYHLEKGIEKYRKSHPEWFKMYRLPKRGHRLEHLSPELQEKIKEELGK